MIRSYIGLGIHPSSPAGPAGGLLLAALFLSLAMMAIRKQRMRFSWLKAAAAVCLAAFLISCGGGGGDDSGQKKPGTPAGTYTITVSATAGNLVRQGTISLTVK